MMKKQYLILLLSLIACINKEKSSYPLNGRYRFLTFIENDTSLNFCSPLYISNKIDSIALKHQDTLNFVFEDSSFSSFVGYNKEFKTEAKIVYAHGDTVFVLYKSQLKDTILFSFSSNKDTVKFKSLSKPGITIASRIRD